VTHLTQRLKSYLQDKWVEGSGKSAAIHDPTTEELIAESATGGLDWAAALAHARTHGVPALAKLTFAERATRLDAFAKALHAKRDELLELATRSGGNTRSDAKFDVDGATGTLAFYANLGRSLGERKFLLDGDMDTLLRSPRYVGQHVYVTRPGVAVHINAFNFPAWGFCEKLAVAFLAGMPAVVKPATSTSPLTVRMLELMLESGQVPAGTISLIAGSCGDLVDHLGPQDVLAFTGSAHTAWSLREKRSIIENSVRFNVEADSLNGAVLGPDVKTDSDTYDLFLREVAKDMTQKAGQKCTAIRRVLVPANIAGDVCEHLASALAAVKVGNPALSEVKMGPVATSSQLADVRKGVDELSKVAKRVHGDGGRGTLHGAGDKGWFVSPVLLRADDAFAARAVHELEVFGPVATVLPYSGSAEEASKIIGLGRGGLVSSVYSDDRDFVAGMIFGIAPYHGRLTIGSGKIAEHSPGPGTVLPSLVHGGPGRAGGGEELGGARGLHFYMQRTAVQGFRPLLEKVFA
jgi:3,4-dehydroadipyl-CoA semialdehyde dehydrogenase